MRLIRRILVLVILAFALSGSLAQAQVAGSIIQVRIPFEFTVGNKAFAAGEYSILRSSSWLVLRNSKHETVAYALAVPAQTQTPPTASVVDFYVEGEKYRLMRVWQANSHYGSELFRPRSLNATALAKAGQVRVVASAQP
jgi:hypothetical protein